MSNRNIEYYYYDCYKKFDNVQRLYKSSNFDIIQFSNSMNIWIKSIEHMIDFEKTKYKTISYYEYPHYKILFKMIYKLSKILNSNKEKDKFKELFNQLQNNIIIYDDLKNINDKINNNSLTKDDISFTYENIKNKMYNDFAIIIHIHLSYLYGVYDMYIKIYP